jgi:sugar/nucleoside kinase (ribokinase family)
VGFWGERVLRANATRVRVVDVTGAGDAFTAGALAIFASAPFDRLDDDARDELLHRALALGCRLGTHAITRLGATAALRRLDRVAPLASRHHTPHRRR